MTVARMFAGLVDKLKGRRVVPPVPPGRVAMVPRDDAVEHGESSGPGMARALFIEYRDAKGQVSNRRIACKRFEPATDTVLAWCFERKAYRRFKLAGILTAACPETGEVYPLPMALAMLRGEAPARHDERLVCFVTLLVFIMDCDREAHALEMEAIDDAVAIYALRFDGDDAMIAEGRELAETLAPDSDDFVEALEWMARQPDRERLARLIDRQVENVIVADQRIASEEAYFGGILRAALQAMFD